MLFIGVMRNSLGQFTSAASHYIFLNHIILENLRGFAARTLGAIIIFIWGSLLFCYCWIME
jgi:hypothetical protein